MLELQAVGAWPHWPLRDRPLTNPSLMRTLSPAARDPVPAQVAKLEQGGGTFVGARS